MAWVLAVLFITLFGSMLFALASGFSRIEKARAEAAAAAVGAEKGRSPYRDSAAAPQVIDAGSATCSVCGAELGRPNIDELLRHIEGRVRSETIAVANFIERPSVESLYGDRCLRGDAKVN